MTEGTDRQPETEGEASSEHADEEEIRAVGAYETGDATVFYDTENPLAWVQSGEVVQLDEMA